MGYRLKYYPPVIEIGILAFSYPDNANGSERAKEGDIITAKIPKHNVMGMGVRKDRIRLHVEGLEENQIGIIKGGNYEDLDEDENPKYDKRRYCVPLKRLKEIEPDFDIDRAKDLNDIYQPFMVLDEDTNKFLRPVKPLSIHGLIYDKYIGDYL